MLESKTHSESHKKDVNTNSILLLVTANVGSLFEDPLTLMQIWVDEFLTTVRQICPHFIALHLQEVGGKIYDKSSNQVKRFVELLCEGLEKQQFFIFRIYMDENINASEQFTALGNLYFCHRTLVRSCIWNFEINSWEPTQRAEKYFGNIETIPTKEKSKFPLEFFPDSKWSRKGFMRTRWNIDGTIVDFVNIHLFHDASNLTAVENSPSVYSQMRRKALLHTLQRFYNDKNNEPVPYFLFGDFNFRCDSASVIKELTRNLTKHRASTTNANSSKVFYRNEIGENVLIIGKKEFHYVENQGMIKDNWLSKYDRDPEPFNDILCEFEFDFKPSYPFEEDPELPNQYMKTRCPAWCDRVLMSSQIPEISSPKKAYEQYNTMGKSICMGDHKPVYLYVEMKSNKALALCDWSLLQKRRRNLARRHCSPRDTSPYFAKMSEIGCSEIDILLKTLMTSITDGKPTLLKHFIQRACANMFFQYMCSVRFDYKDNEFCEVVGFFDEIFWEINQGYAVDFLPWLAPLYKKHMNSLINWSSKIRSFILNRIIYKRENNNEQRQDDFTSALLKSLNEDSNVSRDTIIFMLEDFIGGHSAVGNLVMLIIMYLIKHPNVAKNIQLEADSVSKPSHRTINFYDMDSMPYTMATIFEVLRCSSSPIVPHVATQDTLISGYGVAKGTIVFINNHNLNHNKLYWKQPECFIPERFLKNTYEEQKSVQSKRKLNESEERENDIAEKNMIIKNTQSRGLQIRKGIPYFLPFSIGKRTCIGQNLVRGFGFILVANILRHFNISYDMNSEIEINTGSIALPTKPISVYLIKRKEIF